MAHLTASVEYGLHCLLTLADAGRVPRSAKDLALFQGISPTFVAKILAKLEKAGIVFAVEGARGGYLLTQSLDAISVLAIVDAIEGRKPLFECQEIRARCPLFGAEPPEWASRGVCSIHAVMLKAEKAMRDTLANETLADIAGRLDRKAPAAFAADTKAWFDQRSAARLSRRSAPSKGLTT